MGEKKEKRKKEKASRRWGGLFLFLAVRSKSWIRRGEGGDGSESGDSAISRTGPQGDEENRSVRDQGYDEAAETFLLHDVPPFAFFPVLIHETNQPGYEAPPPGSGGGVVSIKDSARWGLPSHHGQRSPSPWPGAVRYDENGRESFCRPLRGGARRSGSTWRSGRRKGCARR
jgi:hypothetical protein